MKSIFYLIFCLLSVAGSKIFGQHNIQFTGKTEVIGKDIGIFEDPSGKLDFSYVRASGKFVPSKQANPDLGLSKSNFWIKFTINNASQLSQLILDLENPTVTDCHFYFPEDGVYKSIYLSNRWPISQRKYQQPDFLFDIKLKPDSTATFYMKIKGSEQLIIPLILGSRLDIIRSKMNAQVLWGIFIGIIAVMAAYNFLLFLFTKDKSYLWYVLYCLFIGLTQTTLNGYTYHYLFGGYPWLINKVIIIFPALAGITAMLFVRKFLETKNRTPTLHKLFPYPATLYLLAIVFRLAGFDEISFRMIDISALATTLLMYIVAIKISFQGFRPAKYFLIAWTIFFVGIILYSLRNLGLLPYNAFTSYTMGLGTAIELTLLSIALADRITVLKREKELSQAKAIKIAHENERIIREQNKTLEIMVEQRTSDLNAALEDLKLTETQLVESEKMATLGQLTAGIAHEINNPINFVTSNISPLRRDIDALYNTLNYIEQIALSELPKEEKLAKIELHHKKEETDYLREEIAYLISGIHNGASRTAEIVKGLKLFSRLDEDSLKYASINEGIDSAMIIISNQLGNIKVVKNYSTLPLIECYPGKLNQVFLNILSNAIFAIDKSFDKRPGGQITITTCLHQANYVEIIIEDNGIGMDEDTRNKIFNPFFTTKEVGEGTGLGMSISHTIIMKHNGIIQIKSSPGDGARFIINLPLRQDTPT
ncbi:sensor histidine kinase [Arachidicoccus ginsenosidivorans]